MSTHKIEENDLLRLKAAHFEALASRQAYDRQVAELDAIRRINAEHVQAYNTVFTALMAKYGFSGQTDVDLSTGHYTDKSPAPPKLASVSPIIDGAAGAAVPLGQERSPLDNG